MTNKKFAVVGVSTLNGKTKIRFANDSMRIKILLKNGHENVDMINLPHEMTKAEIAQHLTEVGFGNGNPAVTAAVAYIAKKNPKPAQTGEDAPVSAEVEAVEPEVVA
jgi:hypothetical protein